MSVGLIKMWISFAGIILLLIAIGLILLSRYKLKGFFAIIISVLAYICLILGGIIIFYIVLSGPV
ncbi:DUF2768 family protein [Lentibacillus sp. L22]|uniref:DUF2768 family protein n=1 Tax=Lentibacillus TaxID=175304 RepID=UPI0022B0E1EC|nr:DUF2768 family protein [Lentibacillus daqui]